VWLGRVDFDSALRQVRQMALKDTGAVEGILKTAAPAVPEQQIQNLRRLSLEIRVYAPETRPRVGFQANHHKGHP